MVNLLSAQWIQQGPYYPNGAVLWDIFFIDQYTGWTVGEYAEFQGENYWTTDEGMNWNYYFDLIDMPMKSVFFVDQNIGWFVGKHGKVAKTTDGGINWEIDTITGYAYDLTSVFFLNSLNGWTIGRTGEMFKIFHTNNGGIDWDEQASGWGGGFSSKVDICFANENIGWATIGTGGYVNTTDGGITWEPHYFSSESYRGNSLCIVDENNLWIAAWLLGEPKGALFASSDGGISWTQKLGGDTIPYLNDIVFINSYLGWVVGDNGTILHTSDGGQSWIYQESGTSDNLQSVYFVDQNYGWICGDNYIILHTDNGGIVGMNEYSKSMNKLTIYPNPTNDIATVSFELAKIEKINLSITNTKGQEIKQISLGEKEKGKIDLDCSKFSSGIYFINLQTKKGILSEKLIIE